VPKKYTRLSYEDVQEIKFMSENGMSQKDIAYVFDVDQKTISDVLNKDRQRYRREGVSGREKHASKEIGTGCSRKSWFTDDERGTIVFDSALPTHEDITSEEAEVLEFYENVILLDTDDGDKGE